MAVVADGMTICEEKLKRLSAERCVPHDCTILLSSYVLTSILSSMQFSLLTNLVKRKVHVRNISHRIK